VLILNKKAVQNHENALFANELEKFRPHQNRLLQATHKQSALMKDLTAAYGDLLQDKRIRAEQSRYEALSRQRNSILSKFKKTYQAFLDVWEGLEKAQQFYSEMFETAESLDKNVETFVSNRRSEGAMLLSSIEKEKGSDAERQQRRLREMMERVSMGGEGTSPNSSRPSHSQHTSPTNAMSPPTTPRYPQQYPGYGAPTPPPPPPQPPAQAGYGYPGYPSAPPPHQPPPNGSNAYVRRDSYGQLPGLPHYQAQPMARRESNQPLPSPGLAPNSQQYQPGHYSSGPPSGYGATGSTGYQAQPYNPGAYVPPPPPPGPPPLQNRGSFGVLAPTVYQPPPPGQRQRESYGQPPPAPTQSKGGDPWDGLAGWK
jgi:hypothetical protein